MSKVFITDFDPPLDKSVDSVSFINSSKKRKLSFSVPSGNMENDHVSLPKTHFLENDDQMERKRKKIEQRITSISSPLSGARRSVGSDLRIASPAGDLHAKSNATASQRMLTNEQLKEIYTNCIQLSNENKISAKNAFGLMLLDHIQDLLNGSSSQKRNDSPINMNFQVAGCTLDAGVKIYSFRVDCIHNDAYKVNGCFQADTSLLDCGDPSEPPDSEDQKNDDEEKRKNKNSNFEDDIQGSKRRQQSTKQGSKIEKNLKNINIDSASTLSSEGTSDPWDSLISAKPFFNMESNNIYGLFLLNHSISYDSGYVDIDIKSECYKETVNSEINTIQISDSAQLEDFNHTLNDFAKKFGILSEEEKTTSTTIIPSQICGRLDGFSFEKWQIPAKEDVQGNSAFNLLECITGCVNCDDVSTPNNLNKASNTSCNISFDMPAKGLANTFLNCSSGDEEAPNFCGAVDFNPDDKCEEGGMASGLLSPILADSGENIAEESNIHHGYSLLSSSTVPVNMTGGMCLELSIEPSEYSFFAAAMNNPSSAFSYSKQKNGVVKKMTQLMMGPDHWKLSSARSRMPPTLTQDHVTNLKTSTSRRQANVNSASSNKEAFFETYSFLSPLLDERQESLKSFSSNSCHLVSKTLLGNLTSGDALINQTSIISNEKNDPFSVTAVDQSVLDFAGVFPKSSNLSNKIHATENFFKLFLMPHIKFKRGGRHGSDDEDDKDDLQEILFTGDAFEQDQLMFSVHDDQNLGYDVDNENDAVNFCPDISHLSDDDENPRNGNLFDCSLVPEPKQKVTRLEIAYAKMAKKIDVRQLKASIWKMISHVNPYSFNDAGSNSINPVQEEDVARKRRKMSSSSGEYAALKSFKEVYEKLPETLTETSKNTLSTPIAFVCLLHLANEKRLDLSNCGNFRDILIKLPSEQTSTISTP